MLFLSDYPEKKGKIFVLNNFNVFLKIQEILDLLWK